MSTDDEPAIQVALTDPALQPRIGRGMVMILSLVPVFFLVPALGLTAQSIGSQAGTSAKAAVCWAVVVAAVALEVWAVQLGGPFESPDATADAIRARGRRANIAFLIQVGLLVVGIVLLYVVDRRGLS